MENKENKNNKENSNINEPALTSRDYRKLRIEKINKIKEKNINPYPDRFQITHKLNEIADLPDDVEHIRIAGRLKALRIMGNLTFGVLSDMEGSCQIAIQKKIVGVDVYQFMKKLVDIGDFIGIEGISMTTKTGEKTVNALEFVFLGKALLPLPEKFHGISDVEKCYRQRYLDLIMNEDTRKRFVFRSKLIPSIRRFLEKHDFVEVETPVLCNKASGALAKPFATHHNALGIDVFLRIAPETYLKRCVTAGYNKVFEFARCFRNEGISPAHLQDFTMLEYYCAYWNYEDNMRFTQAMFQHVLLETLGTTTIKIGDENIDFSGEWGRIDFRNLILQDCNIDIEKHDDVDILRKEIKSKGIQIDDIDKLGMGNLVDQLYKKVSRGNLKGPVFLTGHPVESSPLARKNDQKSNIADRFQLIVSGAEIVNAYSELVDPLDQRERLEEQSMAKASGDAEAMDMDEDYLKCMEYGMPPISGWGLGIDRLVALLTGCDNIRDVVLFPLNRPE